MIYLFITRDGYIFSLDVTLTMRTKNTNKNNSRVMTSYRVTSLTRRPTMTTTMTYLMTSALTMTLTHHAEMMYHVMLHTDHVTTWATQGGTRTDGLEYRQLSASRRRTRTTKTQRDHGEMMCRGMKLSHQIRELSQQTLSVITSHTDTRLDFQPDALKERSQVKYDMH